MAQVELAISTWAGLCAPSGINIGAGTGDHRAQIAICSVVGRLARVVVQAHLLSIAVGKRDVDVRRYINVLVIRRPLFDLGNDEMPFVGVALVVGQRLGFDGGAEENVQVLNGTIGSSLEHPYPSSLTILPAGSITTTKPGPTSVPCLVVVNIAMPTIYGCNAERRDFVIVGRGVEKLRHSLAAVAKVQNIRTLAVEVVITRLRYVYPPRTRHKKGGQSDGGHRCKCCT